jgi:hypothetical protein
MRATLRALAVAGAMMAAAGCGPKPGSGPRPQPVPVQVTNRNRSDVVLYLLRGGSSTRLGTVVSGQTRTLVIRSVPPTQLNDLQFDVKRIGAEGLFRTRAVSLGPEQMVVVRIEDLLTTSEVTVAENPAPAGGKRLP